METPLRIRLTFCYLYHYGWVNSNDAMQKRLKNATAIGFMDKGKNNLICRRIWGLEPFPALFGYASGRHERCGGTAFFKQGRF